MPTWDGETDGDFLTGTNWSGNVAPTLGSAVEVDNGALANQPTLAEGDFIIVNSVAVSNGTLTIEGTLTATTGVAVSGGIFEIGGIGGVHGNVEISGTGFFKLNNLLYGDLVTTGGTTEIGPIGNITGSILALGGEITLQPSDFLLEIRDLTMDGGARLNIDGSSMSVGSLSGGSGIIDLNASGDTAKLQFGSAGSDTTFSGNIEMEAMTGISKEGAGITELSGAISGGGTVTASGGTLKLSGVNTYTGTTQVAGGTLEVTGGQAIADTGAVVVSNGATFLVSVDQEIIGSLESEDTDPATCTAVVQNDGGLVILGSADTTFAGDIAGAGQLTVAGGGTLTLTGVNTMTGTLAASLAGSEINLTGIGSVASEFIGASSGGLISTDGGAIANAAADLQADNGGTITLGGSEEAGSILVEGTGTINVNGDDTVLTLNGTSGFDNEIYGTVAGSGTLNLTGGVSTVFGGGDVQTDITVGIGAALTNGGTIAGISTAGAFTNTGAVTGNITVTAGTADFNAGSDLADSGTLTVTGGTVNVNTAETLGALAADGGTVNVNAQLDAGTLSGTAGSVVLDDGAGIVAGAANASSTFGGVLSGGGFLQKIGTGTLTLTGANTYTGDTQVAGGTLEVTGGQAIADTGAVVVSNGATFLVSVDQEIIGSLESEDTDPATCTAVVQNDGGLVILGSADTTFAGDIAGAGQLSVGQLSVGGGGTLTLTGVNTMTGTLVAGEAGSEINLTGIGSVASEFINAFLGGLISTDGGAIANSAADLQAGTDGTITLGGSEEVGSIWVEGTGTINVNGDDTVLTLNGTSGLDNEIRGTIAGSGTLNLTGGVSTVFGGGDVQTDITVGTGAALTNGGTIAGISTAGAFTNTGAVTGDITVTAGTADFNAGSDLAASGTLTVTGGTVNVNTAETLGALAADGGTVNVNAQLDAGTLSGTAGSVVLDDGAGIVAGAANASSTFGGVLSGDGFLQKIGSGTLTLTGANTYGDGTTVSGGTLALTGSGSLAGAGVTIDPSATLSTDGRALAASTVLRNDGTLSLTSGGDESIASMLATGTTTLSSGSVLTLNSDTSAISGIVSGEGGLTIAGTSTAQLLAANTYTGTTTVSAGALAITGAGSIASASVNIAGGTLTTDSDALAAGATVGISGTGTFTSSGTDSFTAITQTGGTIAGTGVLTLSGAFAQSGGTTGGLVGINAAAFMQSGGAIVAAGTVVTSSGAQTLQGGTIAGTLDGAGAITAGTGVTNVTGTITNAASFTLSSGIVNLTGSGSIDTTGNSITINGGTLNDDGDAIADTDGVSVNGSGILNLTGDDTIAGLQGNGTVNLAGNALTIAQQTSALGAMTFRGGDGADAPSLTLAASLKNFSLSGVTFTNWTAAQDTITITGNSLGNRITGSAAVEILQGGGGKDIMKGGGGKDMIDGGTGKDTLSGGGARDTFLFVVGDSKDTITDFDVKGKDSDIIDLEDISAVKSFKDLMKNHVDDVGSNVVITLGAGQSIKLIGVQERDLEADMFII